MIKKITISISQEDIDNSIIDSVRNNPIAKSIEREECDRVTCICGERVICIDNRFQITHYLNMTSEAKLFLDKFNSGIPVYPQKITIGESSEQQPSNT